MNDPMIIAGAIVLVIGAIGSVIIQIINAMAAATERREARISRLRVEEFAKINDEKNDKIIEKTAEIHHSTNSNLSKVTSDLAIALTKIDGLERIINTHPTKIVSDIKTDTINVSADTVSVDAKVKGEK